MKFELELTLEDKPENLLRFQSLGKIIVKVDSLEYEVTPQTIQYNTECEEFYSDLINIGYRVGRDNRTLRLTAWGVNKKEQDIKEAKALVNSTKEAHKAAQRKLSELMEGK